MWDFLPLFWKKDVKKCYSIGIPWSSSHSIFLLSQGNTNFTWYADGGFRNLQKRMEQEKHEVSSQILTWWWGFKTFRQLRTIAAKVLQTLSNLLCIIWLIHLYHVYSKTVRRKGASSYRVLGKWSLSPSGRVTFSTSENGCVERYSAEVRLVFIGNFRWQSRVCLPNDRKYGFSLLNQQSDVFCNFFVFQFQPNPFGDAPRMVKGTIVDDNVRWGFRNLFRRVTASFSAEGFGKDTLDTSYRSRGSL